jgi:hypothetical protein
MDRAVLQGVLIDEAIEVLFQRARDFGRSTGARAIHQTRRALGSKAMDPRAEGGRGQLQRVGDGLQTLTFDDVTDRLSAPEDPGLFGLFHERVSGGQGVIGNVQCEGPQERALS